MALMANRQFASRRLWSIPIGTIRGASAYYVLVPPKGKLPEAASLQKHPGSRKIALKVDKDQAVAEFTLDKTDGEVAVQVVAERSGGQSVATAVRSHSLLMGFKVEDLARPPPSSWIDFSPKDKSFAVWLPAKPIEQAEKERSVEVNDERMRISSVVGKTANGLIYIAEYLVLPAGLAAHPPVRLHALLRTVLLEDGKGRFTDSVEAQSGSLNGVQYRIDYGDEIARARVFISQGGVVRLVRVIGTTDQVAALEADMILLSFRMSGDQLVGRNVVPPRVGGLPRLPAKGLEVPNGKQPFIVAGGHASAFKDVGPEGGMLIGLEIGVGKFGSLDVIKAVRPIYRVGGKEKFGAQRGTSPAEAVTIKARGGLRSWRTHLQIGPELRWMLIDVHESERWEA
jgi:hypothetical protein